jgi:uncharacterized membrane protein
VQDPPPTLRRVAPPTEQARVEADEGAEQEDNSLGRLLTLSDGVFAIAMTLLAFNLKVPDIGPSPDDHALRHALAHQSATYLSFVVSFYAIAGYWTGHRRMMRSVATTHPRMVRQTLFLLFIVASIPFMASLLGQYGGTPIALALYGVTNALAVLTLQRLRRDLRRLRLVGDRALPPMESSERHQAMQSLVVFLLCIPAGYVLGHHGPWVLVLLAVPLEVPSVIRRAAERRRRHQRALASQ